MLRGFFHFLAEAERSHVGPYLLDVSEALLFRTSLARVIPAKGVFAVGRPDRILLLVVQNDFIDSGIFSFICAHGTSPGPSFFLRSNTRNKSGPLLTLQCD